MAVTQSKPGRSRRKQEVYRLDGVTWFGDLVICLTFALREIQSTEARLKLCEDMTAYIGRQYGEISGHERARRRAAS